MRVSLNRTMVELKSGTAGWTYRVTVALNRTMVELKLTKDLCGFLRMMLLIVQWLN